MRWLKVTLVGLLLGIGCAAAAGELFHDQDERDVPLYFALEVREAGHVVARPQLVGASGHELRAVVRSRDGAPRLELDLAPTLRGPRVGLDLQLALTDTRGLGKSVVLHHGEETTLNLSRDVQVKVLAMRVQSPEFEAYMANAPALGEDAAEGEPSP